MWSQFSKIDKVVTMQTYLTVHLQAHTDHHQQGKNALNTNPSTNYYSPKQQQIPDMVPTPITRHSTRASKVKVGPSTAIPRAMLSLTSSWKSCSDQSVVLLNFMWNIAIDVNISSYLRTGAQSKLGKSTCFGEVNEKQEEGQSLTGGQNRTINWRFSHRYW